MRRMMRCALAATTILLVCALTQGLAKDEKDEMTDNPYYKGWAGFKTGSKVVLIEMTVYGDGSNEEKTVEYKLSMVMPERVIVRTAVIERGLLSLVETAPTRIYYPAKVSKAEITAALQDADAKRGKEVIKVMDKDLECTTFEITRKSKTEEIKSKTWRSSTVPGGVVKRVRSTSTNDGKLIATTTTTLQSFVEGDGKKEKDKE